MSNQERDEFWQETLMLHGWPECGPGSLFIERLYQAFKDRLEREIELPRLERELEQIKIRAGFGAVHYGHVAELDSLIQRIAKLKGE